MKNRLESILELWLRMPKADLCTSIHLDSIILWDDDGKFGQEQEFWKRLHSSSVLAERSLAGKVNWSDLTNFWAELAAKLVFCTLLDISCVYRDLSEIKDPMYLYWCITGTFTSPKALEDTLTDGSLTLKILALAAADPGPTILIISAVLVGPKLGQNPWALKESITIVAACAIFFMIILGSLWYCENKQSST